MVEQSLLNHAVDDEVERRQVSLASICTETRYA